MYKISPKLHNVIDVMIHHTENTLIVFHRFMFVVVIFGAVFSLMCFPALEALKNPVQFAKLDYLFINTIELNDSNTPKDLNYDGTLAGANSGATLLQGIPLIGTPLGFLLGGLIGHQVDDNF